MDAKLKADWVAALRSDKFKQVRSSVGDKQRNRLCCLGVGAVVADPAISLFYTDDAVKALRQFGLDGERNDVGDYTGNARQLIDLNDLEAKSFPEIADWIEANIPADDHSVRAPS